MGATALMLATGQAQVNLIQALIDQGAEIDLQVTITDSVGWSVRRSVGWLVGWLVGHSVMISSRARSYTSMIYWRTCQLHVWLFILTILTLTNRVVQRSMTDRVMTDD